MNKSWYAVQRAWIPMQQVSGKTVEQSSDKSSFCLGGILFAMRETAGKMIASCDGESLFWWIHLERVSSFRIGFKKITTSCWRRISASAVVSAVQENRYDDVCYVVLYSILLVQEETTVCIFFLLKKTSVCQVVPPVTFFSVIIMMMCKHDSRVASELNLPLVLVLVVA